MIAVIAGSGNLSRNGLVGGHELGNLTLVSSPTTKAEREAWDSCQRVAHWFETLWKPATEYSKIESEYGDIYSSVEHLVQPVPTDEDAGTFEGTSRLPIDKIGQLRACKNFWIESGNITRNRGPNLPGNQLMMSPMTRVFFGFSANRVPTDTLLGNVAIKYDTKTVQDRSLRFSNNSMNVLTLPVPGTDGPAQYDNETLLFTQITDGQGTRNELIVGSPRQKTGWLKSSKKIGGAYSMSSGRKWGVF